MLFGRRVRISINKAHVYPLELRVITNEPFIASLINQAALQL